MATVNELITALGFELSPDAQATLGRYGDMLSGVGDMAKEMWKNVEKAGQTAQKRTVMKSVTGISPERQQQWRQVAAQAGADAESFLETIGRLHKLGATQGDILKWADELKGASVRERMTLQQELGLADEDVFVLLQGSKEIKKAMDSVLVTSKEIVKGATEFNQAKTSSEQKTEEAKTEVYQGIGNLFKEPMKWWDKYLGTKEGKESVQATELMKYPLGLASILSGATSFQAGAGLWGNLINTGKNMMGVGAQGAGAASGGTSFLGNLGMGLAYLTTIFDVMKEYSRYLTDPNYDPSTTYKEIGQFESWTDAMQYLNPVTNAKIVGKEIGDDIAQLITPVKNIESMIKDAVETGAINVQLNVLTNQTQPGYQSNPKIELQPTTQGGYQSTMIP